MLGKQPLELGLFEIGQLGTDDFDRALDLEVESAVAEVGDGWFPAASTRPRSLGLREQCERRIFGRARAISSFSCVFSSVKASQRVIPVI
jgi:hypothetical protein